MELGLAGWLFHRPILHERTMTQLDLPAVARDLGVRTIELVSTFFPSQRADYLNQLRQAIQEAGVRVRNIAVDMGNIAHPDEVVRRTDLEALKQWFYVARAIGAEAIRVNSGPGDDAAALERIVSGYRELAAEAARAGVYLLIENHGGASADPQNIARFLQAVDSPWFRTCPDTGNFPGETWREGMQVMAPVAFSCHVKVYQYSPDGWQERVGRDGQVHRYNLRECLAVLKAAGYRGPLCLEAGVGATPLESARTALDYVRRLWETL